MAQLTHAEELKRALQEILELCLKTAMRLRAVLDECCIREDKAELLGADLARSL